MKLTLIVFGIALCLAATAQTELEEQIHGNGIYTTADTDKAYKKTEALRKEFEAGGMKRIAQRTDDALGAVLYIAVINLKRKGFKTEAREIEQGWEKFHGELPRLVANPSRKITDFAPLSDWLAKMTWKIRDALGDPLFRALRLCDLVTFNYTIPVVFSPCQYGEEEFWFHFVHDVAPGGWKGLLPVTSYWLASITCSVATFGAGAVAFFVCSPISMLVEIAVDAKIAPWLAPKLYSWACSND